MSEPVAIGEPRQWTLHSSLEPEPGDLWGTPRYVYLCLRARRMDERHQTDVHGLTRWKLTVVPVERQSVHDRTIYETQPCRTDGTPR